MTPADVETRLAAAWASRERCQRAMEGYRKAIALEPAHREASRGLSDLLVQHGRLSEALEVLGLALNRWPNDSELHKRNISTLIERDGWGEAARVYGLERRDGGDCELGPHEVVVVTVVRDEVERLPFFLSYYRNLGVSRFFFVENQSQDGSGEYLLTQPDVHLWSGIGSFNAANFGSAWFELILRRYAVGCWCLIVDSDEFFCYPQFEQRSLPELCRGLQRARKQAMDAVLLEMYGEGKVADAHHQPGDDLLQLCPYFDAKFYHQCHPEAGPYRNQTAYLGGARARVFGDQVEYYLSKVPLLQYQPHVLLAGGQHWTNLPPAKIASQSGALLHTKYLASFGDKAQEQVARGEHYAEAVQYREYARAGSDLCFYSPQHSVRFENSAQLVELGIMRKGDEDFAAPEFPPVKPVASGERPFWSVIVTVYRRLDTLKQALESVLTQAEPPENMQILVLQDGVGPDEQAAARQLVLECGGDRVEFVGLPERLGQPYIFNRALELARGQWIHILHDDDWISPGFYQALRPGLTDTVGYAFSRYSYVDAQGERLRLSPLEQEAPGLLNDWLERIAVFCRLQTPSVVVNRSAYEAVGGYCAQAGSAFDWEMWMRLASRFPVYYEPAVLAHFREHAGALSSHLLRSGEQVAHTGLALDCAASYLPAALVARGRRRYARYALEVAARLRHSGDLEGANNNLRQAGRLDRSWNTQAHLWEHLG